MKAQIKKARGSLLALLSFAWRYLSLETQQLQGKRWQLIRLR
jgi:hypothetical protein